MKANEKWQRAFEPDIPDWDAAELWQRIEQELPSRRRRFLFWWLFAGLGLLLVSGAIAYVRFGAKEKPRKIELVLDNNELLIVNKNFLMTQDSSRHSDAPYSSVPPAYELLVLREAVTVSHRLPYTRLVGKTEPVMQRRQAWHPGLQTESGTITSLSCLPVRTPPLITPLFSAQRFIPPVFQPIITPSSPKRGAYLSLSTGIFYTKRTLTARSAADQPYANAKKQSEQPLETITVTGMLHLPLGRHLDIGAGLTYQRSTQWFRTTVTQVAQQQVPSDSATYYNVNGITHYESGYLLQETTTTRHIQAPGVQERWSIPVQLAWRWHFGRSTLGMAGGALFNLHSAYRGYALDPQLVLIEKDPIALRGLYRSTGVHSAYAGMDYHWALSRRWQLSLGLRYQRDLRSVLRPETGLVQRNQLVGGHVGIIYAGGNK